MYIINCDTVSSTNDELKILADKGAPHFTILTAKQQTNGRGRYNRKWVSDSGNLFLSILVRPKNIHSNIALICGIAVLKAAQKFTTDKLQLKWPNDVLLNGKKVAGILVEAINHYIIIGVGVNTISAPEFAIALNVPTQEFHDIFLFEFEKCYQTWEQYGFKALQSQFLEYAAFLGQEVTIKMPENNFIGIIKSITTDGELELNLNGQAKIISVGEIFA